MNHLFNIKNEHQNNININLEEYGGKFSEYEAIIRHDYGDSRIIWRKIFKN
jgi:hypothetical protein